MSFYAERKKAGFSQAAVAKEIGVSAAAVCQWETGKTVPDSRKLPRIAALFGCTVDDLVTGEEKEAQQDAEN